MIMSRLMSQVSTKILAVIGVSTLGYKLHSCASAETLPPDSYISAIEEDVRNKRNKLDSRSDEALIRKLKKAAGDSKSLVQRFMLTNSVPGLVIGVSFRGQEVWVKGFGFSNIELGAKCKPETVMRIASISKPITMLLVAKLVEEGKLDLDKSIYEYVKPEKFPRKQWQGKDVDITLRQLVSHLGGIRHYKNPTGGSEFDMQEYYIRKKYKDVFESLEIFKDDDLVAAPGTEFHYTTFGWTLISAVVESVLPTGQSFGSYLTDQILKKELGMHATYIDKNEPIVRDRASYYCLTKKGILANAPFVENEYKIAGGGLLSTIPDLLKFGNVMMYSFRGGDRVKKLDGFLKRETVEEMWKPAPNTDKLGGRSQLSRFFNYGMGWFVVRDDVKLQCAACASPPFSTIAYHSGAAVGASSAILVLPDQEIVVAAFCNLQSVSLTDLANEVAKLYAAKLTPKSPLKLSD